MMEMIREIHPLDFEETERRRERIHPLDFEETERRRERIQR